MYLMTARMKMKTMMLLMMMIYENNLPVVREERFLKDTAPPMPDTYETHLSSPDIKGSFANNVAKLFTLKLK